MDEALSPSVARLYADSSTSDYSDMSPSVAKALAQGPMNDPLQTATDKALAAGASPSDLKRAKAELGKQEYVGYCQSFVEKVSGQGIQGPTAYKAWQNQQDKAVSGLNGIKPGDHLYFSPNQSNHYNGHVGISAGGNKFISATDNGVQQYDINDWQNMTGQQPLGYIPFQGQNNE